MSPEEVLQVKRAALHSAQETKAVEETPMVQLKQAVVGTKVVGEGELANQQEVFEDNCIIVLKNKTYC